MLRQSRPELAEGPVLSLPRSSARTSLSLPLVERHALYYYPRQPGSQAENSGQLLNTQLV